MTDELRRIAEAAVSYGVGVHVDNPQRILALLDVADAAREQPEHYSMQRLDRLGEPDEPVCGVCDDDWPCAGQALREALDRLEALR